MRNVWLWVVYSVPFTKGHTLPGGRGEVLGDIAVGVVVFKVPVEMPEEETEIPVGVPEEVVLVIPLETTVEELVMVGPDLGGPDDALEAEAVELGVVVLGNNETLVVDGTMLETGAVVPLARELDTVTVVVVTSKAVPEMVPS